MIVRNRVQGGSDVRTPNVGDAAARAGKMPIGVNLRRQIAFQPAKRVKSFSPWRKPWVRGKREDSPPPSGVASG